MIALNVLEAQMQTAVMAVTSQTSMSVCFTSCVNPVFFVYLKFRFYVFGAKVWTQRVTCPKCVSCQAALLFPCAFFMLRSDLH